MARILIVDDERTIRTIVRFNLDKRGHEVVDAPGGIEALEILSADQAFDLIISDMMMPRMDGLQLRQKLVEDGDLGRIPFIMLTAVKEADRRVESYDLDVTDYITKPFNAQELMAKVESVLRLQQTHRVYTAEQRLDVIKQLTVTINHEINNPLTTLIGTSNLLLQRATHMDPHKLEGWLKEIVNAAERIREVVAKINRIKAISTKTYLSDVEMIDIDAAADAS